MHLELKIDKDSCIIPCFHISCAISHAYMVYSISKQTKKSGSQAAFFKVSALRPELIHNRRTGAGSNTRSARSNHRLGIL